MRGLLFRRGGKEVGRLMDVGLAVGCGALALVLAVAVFVLFDGFEGELDLAVEGGKVGFELFELVFLFPRFFDYFLKDGDVLGNLFHFFLVFLQKRGNGFEGAEEHLGGNVGVFCQSAAIEVVQDVAFATDEEAVFDEVEAVFHAGFGLYQEVEAVELADGLGCAVGTGFVLYLGELFGDEFGVVAFDTVQFDKIEGGALVVALGALLEVLYVRADTGDQVAVLGDGLHDVFQFGFGGGFATVEGFALAFEGGNLFLQLGFVQQVGIAGEDGNILGEVHAALFVHAALVDCTGTHRTFFELGDEQLLVVKQVEFVAVEGFLDGVVDNIDFVVGKEFGYLVAFSYTTAVALLQIFGRPGNVELMDGDTLVLGIYAGAEHVGGTEEDAVFAFFHGINHCHTGLFGLGFLNEANLICRDAVVVHQFALDFAVCVPLTGLVGAQIRKDELGAFLFVVLPVVLVYQGGAMGGFVIYVVVVFVLVDKAHVEGHLAGIVGGNEHLGFFFPAA